MKSTYKSREPTFAHPNPKDDIFTASGAEADSLAASDSTASEIETSVVSEPPPHAPTFGCLQSEGNPFRLLSRNHKLESSTVKATDATKGSAAT